MPMDMCLCWRQQLKPIADCGDQARLDLLRQLATLEVEFEGALPKPIVNGRLGCNRIDESGGMLPDKALKGSGTDVRKQVVWRARDEFEKQMPCALRFGEQQIAEVSEPWLREKCLV